MTRAVERRYYTVPFPVATYDHLLSTKNQDEDDTACDGRG